MRQQNKLTLRKLAACVLSLGLPLTAAETPTDSRQPQTSTSDAPAASSTSDIDQLKAMLLEQQKQLNELRKELADQKKPSDTATSANTTSADTKTSTPAPVAATATDPKSNPIASTVPLIPPGISLTPRPNASSFVPEPQAAAPPTTDVLQKSIDAINANLRGFRLSGDLRFRTDTLYRQANTDYGSSDNRSTPAQRIRERYRVRLNVDKDLFSSDKSDRPLAHAHIQLATDPFNNPNTMDTDFTGITTRAPISIAEAYIDFMPTKSLTFRIGRTPEIFADNRQFVYDDDVRFNGFHETYRWSSKKNGFFVEAKAAQYILTEPNVQVVPAGSPFLLAGYQLGQRVPSSDLLDQGITVGSNITKKWSHNETVNYFVIREPNQLALAATAQGIALFGTSGVVGANLIGNLPESGNGLTTAGGAMFTAKDFHVVRGGLNINYSGSQWRGKTYPFQIFLQATHNTGASFDNNGYMLGASIGQAAKLGDVQFQYQYFYKPGNAFVSTLTDDDVGSGAGVNVKTNQARINFGLTRFLVWENRFYIQKGISTNNPALNYFLPLQAGYNTQLRIHSQLVFTF